jgi:predicted TIM-barrel fold metal-dependent hydrolase
MDGAGVDAAVVVQFVGGYGYDCRYAADAVTDAAGRLRLCAAVDMEGPDPAADLRALARTTDVAAVRVFGVAGAEEPPWLSDGRAHALWRAAEETGTSIVATLWDRHLHHLRPLAAAHPDVPVAVDHCGFVDFGDGPEPLLSLAELPSIHVKVSTLVLQPHDDPADVVDLLAGRFGAHRLLWGSDHPQTGGTYDDKVTLARHASRHLLEGDRAAFLGGTARHLWFG